MQLNCCYTVWLYLLRSIVLGSGTSLSSAVMPSVSYEGMLVERGQQFDQIDLNNGENSIKKKKKKVHPCPPKNPKPNPRLNTTVFLIPGRNKFCRYFPACLKALALFNFNQRVLNK